MRITKIQSGWIFLNPNPKSKIQNPNSDVLTRRNRVPIDPGGVGAPLAIR